MRETTQHGSLFARKIKRRQPGSGGFPLWDCEAAICVSASPEGKKFRLGAKKELPFVQTPGQDQGEGKREQERFQFKNGEEKIVMAKGRRGFVLPVAEGLRQKGRHSSKKA